MPKKGYKQTEGHKRKNRNARIKMWENPNFRKKISKIYKNSISRKEHLQKLHKFTAGKHLSPATEFKKGMTPWNKDKKGHVAWNKNLPPGQQPNWKGGKKGNGRGYILIKIPEHPFATKQGYVMEHRLVIEKQIGRYLLPKEVVHHINEIRDDNRIENLMCFESSPTHLKFHCTPANIKPKEIIFDGRKLN